MLVIYNYGGFYWDTDVQLLKSLDTLLDYEAFFATERPGRVASGLGFGACKHNNIVVTVQPGHIHKVPEYTIWLIVFMIGWTLYSCGASAR